MVPGSPSRDRQINEEEFDAQVISALAAETKSRGSADSVTELIRFHQDEIEKLAKAALDPTTAQDLNSLYAVSKGRMDEQVSAANVTNPPALGEVLALILAKRALAAALKPHPLTPDPLEQTPLEETKPETDAPVAAALLAAKSSAAIAETALASAALDKINSLSWSDLLAESNLPATTDPFSHCAPATLAFPAPGVGRGFSLPENARFFIIKPAGYGTYLFGNDLLAVATEALISNLQHFGSQLFETVDTFDGPRRYCYAYTEFDIKYQSTAYLEKIEDFNTEHDHVCSHEDISHNKNPRYKLKFLVTEKHRTFNAFRGVTFYKTINGVEHVFFQKPSALDYSNSVNMENFSIEVIINKDKVGNLCRISNEEEHNLENVAYSYSFDNLSSDKNKYAFFANWMAVQAKMAKVKKTAAQATDSGNPAVYRRCQRIDLPDNVMFYADAHEGYGTIFLGNDIFAVAQEAVLSELRYLHKPIFYTALTFHGEITYCDAYSSLEVAYKSIREGDVPATFLYEVHGFSDSCKGDHATIKKDYFVEFTVTHHKTSLKCNIQPSYSFMEYKGVWHSFLPKLDESDFETETNTYTTTMIVNTNCEYKTNCYYGDDVVPGMRSTHFYLHSMPTYSLSPHSWSHKFVNLDYDYQGEIFSAKYFSAPTVSDDQRNNHISLPKLAEWLTDLWAKASSSKDYAGLPFDPTRPISEGEIYQILAALGSPSGSLSFTDPVTRLPEDVSRAVERVSRALRATGLFAPKGDQVKGDGQVHGLDHELARLRSIATLVELKENIREFIKGAQRLLGPEGAAALQEKIGQPSLHGKTIEDYYPLSAEESHHVREQRRALQEERAERNCLLIDGLAKNIGATREWAEEFGALFNELLPAEKYSSEEYITPGKVEKFIADLLSSPLLKKPLAKIARKFGGKNAEKVTETLIDYLRLKAGISSAEAAAHNSEVDMSRAGAERVKTEEQAAAWLGQLQEMAALERLADLEEVVANERLSQQINGMADEGSSGTAPPQEPLRDEQASLASPGEDGSRRVASPRR